MEFFAVNGKRPVRLSEQTRQFAFDSLNCKYGKETFSNYAVRMDDYENFETLTDLEKYNAVIERIVSTAPIRICENEKISGAATLGLAILSRVPATYKDEPIFFAVDHLTIDFKAIVDNGFECVEEIAKASLEKHRSTEKEPLCLSFLHAIDCFKIWHKRYLDALKDDPRYAQNYSSLLQVPFKGAQNFHQAVQSLWFTFAFLRLFGYWSGIGRIDYILGKYLEKDLADGVLTLDEAREILAHFFIKGCEWIRGEVRRGGDAQHYQNILLGGVDENGNEVTNNVTYLVLDVLEELSISDFPTSIRLNKNSPEKLLRRAAQVIKLGGGVVAVYNEEVVIDSLLKAGYPEDEAKLFCNDGCWEVQVPGKTCFNYIAIDGLSILQYGVLKAFDAHYDSFEELLDAYCECLIKTIKTVQQRDILAKMTLSPSGEYLFDNPTPCSVISLFEEGCVENAVGYIQGGTKYRIRSPHLGGIPDVVNSLYAIKKVVFDEKKLSFDAFMKILKNNWDGEETRRQYVLNKYSYYGNDNDEVDEIAVKVVDAFATACDDRDLPLSTCPGISSFARQIDWAPYRLATPYGKHAHSVLAANFSPSPATDKNGATAIIKSYCKCDLSKMTNGAALDIKLLPSAVNCENGEDAIISLLKGFVELGGHFMQLDVADTALLKAAQENPEEYRNLSVRVSGWNARFATLEKKWQDMIIEQSGRDF